MTLPVWLDRAVNWALGLYDEFMRRSLGLPFLRTYYDEPDAYVAEVSRRHLRLSPDDLRRAQEVGLLEVVGREPIDRIASRVIRWHALLAGLMTLLCTLPQNWVIWPLMLVDIVFFQKEIFTVTQKLEVLYARPGERASLGFDYATLAATAVKMGGTALKQKAIDMAKRGGGKGLRMAVEYGSKAGARSLRVLVAQAFKWCGVVVSRETVDLAIMALVVFVSALIAGLVSFWLFVPMARRLQRKLVRQIDWDSL